MKNLFFNLSLFLLILFFFSISAQSQEQQGSSSLVRDVTLAEESPLKEKNKDKTPPLPDRLIIGIDMKAKAFFKLSSLAAGTLSQGMNMIVLPVEGLFERSGSHSYVLEVKAGELEERINILLDIEINTQLPGNNPGRSSRIYEVSIFVGDSFVGALQKVDNTFARILEKGKHEPAPIKLDPRYPVPGSKPPAAAISPLTLAALAFRGIKKQLDKNKLKKIRPNHRQKITGNYSHKDKNGNEEILNVSITIKHQQLNQRKD